MTDEIKGVSTRNWRHLYQRFDGMTYELYIEGYASATAPFPFFKPGVEYILRELERPPEERDRAAIDAGLAMLDKAMLSDLLGLPDDASRILLLAAYDPRFEYVLDGLRPNLCKWITGEAARRCKDQTSDRVAGPMKVPGGRRSQRGSRLANLFGSRPELATKIVQARGRKRAAMMRGALKDAHVSVFGDQRDKSNLAICLRAAKSSLKSCN